MGKKSIVRGVAASLFFMLGTPVLSFFLGQGQALASPSNQTVKEQDNIPLVSSVLNFTSMTAAGLTAWVNGTNTPYATLLIAFGDAVKNFPDILKLFKPCYDPPNLTPHFQYPSFVFDRFPSMNGVSVFFIHHIFSWMQKQKNDPYKSETINEQIQDDSLLFMGQGLQITVSPVFLDDISSREEISSLEEKKKHKSKKKEKEKVAFPSPTAISLKNFLSLTTQTQMDLFSKEGINLLMRALSDHCLGVSYDEASNGFDFNLKNLDNSEDLLKIRIQKLDTFVPMMSEAEMLAPFIQTDLKRGLRALTETTNSFLWAVLIALRPDWLSYGAFGYFIGNSLITGVDKIVDKVNHWHSHYQEEKIDDFVGALLGSLPYVSGDCAEVVLEFYDVLLSTQKQKKSKIVEQNQNLVSFSLESHKESLLNGARVTLKILSAFSNPNDMFDPSVQGVAQTHHKEILEEIFYKGHFQANFSQLVDDLLTHKKMQFFFKDLTLSYVIKAHKNARHIGTTYESDDPVLGIDVHVPKFSKNPPAPLKVTVDDADIMNSDDAI